MYREKDRVSCEILTYISLGLGLRTEALRLLRHEGGPDRKVLRLLGPGPGQSHHAHGVWAGLPVQNEVGHSFPR